MMGVGRVQYGTMQEFVKLESVDRHQEVRVVQLTDSHLPQRPGDRVSGIRSDDSLAAVLARLRDWTPLPHLMLATGDIADDGAAQAYRRFQHAVNRVQESWIEARLKVTSGCVSGRLDADGRVPYFAIPGNHDELPVFYAEFARHTPTAIDAGNWRIVLLDSVVAGQDPGFLTSTQQQRLLDAVQTAGARHVLVVLHHPPMEIGAPWLDNLKLENASWLFSTIERFPSIRGVLCGHVHQEFEGWYRSTRSAQTGGPAVRLLASPATCVQFKPGAEEYQVDSLGPGFRWLCLRPEGEIETGIERVDWP